MDAVAALDEIAPRLSRWPDVEAHDLVAVDATDRIVLAEAQSHDDSGLLPDEIVVIGDRHGAITLAALTAGVSRIRVHQDALTGERALDANAETLGVAGFTHHDLGASLLDGAHLVLVQLPRSLAALDEIAETIRAHAAPDVRVVAGGRIKHMTHGMNDVLDSSFGAVTASRAAGKSRVLHASGPRATTQVQPWPRTETHDGLVIAAHGGAFAGTGLDIGTRFLLEHIGQMRQATHAIDLGSGTGVLATRLAIARPGIHVIATDQSSAAVRSTRATAEANGVESHVTVVRDDGLQSQPDASADLIVLNPPFHTGAAVSDEIAPRLFAEAARVLAPGGELWCVFNSHLGYRGDLERLVGRTRQAGRNQKFTVTVSTRG